MPDVTEQEEDPNANLITITPEQEEVDKGVEGHNILDVDARRYIKILSPDAAALYWRPVFCTTCRKPQVVHDPLQQGRCPRTAVTQAERTRYEKVCRNNDTMTIAAEILTVREREELAEQ